MPPQGAHNATQGSHCVRAYYPYVCERSMSNRGVTHSVADKKNKHGT